MIKLSGVKVSMPKMRFGYGFILASSIVLPACTLYDSVAEKGEIQYKSAGKTKPLDVPPDLNTLPRDERFTVPDAARSTSTFSDLSKTKSSAPILVDGKRLLPNVPSARIDRQGTSRWLIVDQPADKVWNAVKEFWIENGFLLTIEQQEVGIMETDWAENRSKIPQDIIRRTIGKVFDGLYSSGERDKYRTRIEKNGNSTEVYVSHRGVKEVFNSSKDISIWEPRNNDPELEIEFLRRLMLKFGTDVQQTQESVALTRQSINQTSLLVDGKEGQSSYLEVPESFDRTWRRVGLALDRVNFTVEDRDRANGIYFVRYVDPDEDGEARKNQGFFSKIFTASNKDKARQQFQVKVSSFKMDASKVEVVGAQANTDTNKTAQRILTLLREQLK